MHVYLCELLDKEPERLEHNNIVWYEKDKLNELDFVEADYKFLNLLK